MGLYLGGYHLIEMLAAVFVRSAGYKDVKDAGRASVAIANPYGLLT